MYSFVESSQCEVISGASLPKDPMLCELHKGRIKPKNAPPYLGAESVAWQYSIPIRGAKPNCAATQVNRISLHTRFGYRLLAFGFGSAQVYWCNKWRDG